MHTVPLTIVLLQETYDTIPGQNKITFLLQAIRDASAAEEVCTCTHSWSWLEIHF